MQSLLLKECLKFDDIIEYYVKNEKSSELKIGLEYERISLNIPDLSQAKFENLFSIIRNFAKINNWELIFDEKTLLGATNNSSSISLEPGGQFEISLSPKKNLGEIYFLMQSYISQIDEIAKRFNTKFFAIGCNPKNCYQNIELLDKRRYKLMAEFLVKKGKFAPVMMRETAGVQVNTDYKSSIDAKRKIRAALYMSPFLTGFFANSPYRNNKLTKYKSFRALAWKYTGSERCALFYKNIIDLASKNVYEEYANYILDVPMIYIVRNEKYVNIDGKITFRDFMQNGYCGYSAAFEDYLLHQSLCFPDVRLKNCIEIRNHDSQNLEVAIAIAGIYKGILYNDSAIDKILNLLVPLTSYDLEKYGFLASKYGVNFKVEKLNLYAYEIVNFILQEARNRLCDKEKKYLDRLIEIANSKKCIADIALESIR